MNPTGPVLVIEDDKDDQELFLEVFKEQWFGNILSSHRTNI